MPIFCYICEILRHDEKHCLASPLEQSSGRQYGEWLKAGGALKIGGEKEKLKEQTRVEKGSAVPMGVDSEAKEECGIGVCVSSAMAVREGAKVVKNSVSMMEANRLECVKLRDLEMSRLHVKNPVEIKLFWSRLKGMRLNSISR